MPDLLALHIPDGFLTSSVAVLAAVPAALVLALALRRADLDLDERRVPLLGVTAAFIFAVQMLNFPVAGGTSGHLLGAALAAILLGPWLAVIVMTVVLTGQAFVFADGGITALGANVLCMGVLGAFAVGFGMRAVRRVLPKSNVVFLGIVAVGSWVAVMGGAGDGSRAPRPLRHRPLLDRPAGHARSSRPHRDRRGRDHRRRRGRRGAWPPVPTSSPSVTFAREEIGRMPVGLAEARS